MVYLAGNYAKTPGQCNAAKEQAVSVEDDVIVLYLLRCAMGSTGRTMV